MSFLLADAIYWIAVACCTVAQIAIIHSVVISPARVAGSEPTSTARRTAEIAWAVIPGIALVFLLVFTRRAMDDFRATSSVAAATGASAAATSVTP
jgi:heme/copper-type cytochrome/quinol oxidase subunit 2